MISEDRKREKNKKKIQMSKKIEIQVGNQIIPDDRKGERKLSKTSIRGESDDRKISNKSSKEDQKNKKNHKSSEDERKTSRKPEDRMTSKKSSKRRQQINKLDIKR